MPIPTRSQSVRAPSQIGPQRSESSTIRSSAREGSNREASQPQVRPSGEWGHPPTTPSAASHTRSSSIATSGLPRPRPTLGNTSDSQNPSVSRVPPKSTRPAHGRTPSTLPSLGHSRSQSTSVIQNESIGGRHVSSAKPPERGILHKPAFNTYQQHFSPQKSHPAARTQPLKPEESGLSKVSQQESGQTSRLQDELFQLSLVHQQSAKTLMDFEKDVKRKLDLAAVKLRRAGEVDFALEAEQQKQINVAALSNWLHEDGATVNEPKVEDLNFCLNELADMGDEGQVIDQLRSEFARWLEKAQMTIEAQSPVALDLTDDLQILSTGTPGTAWSREVDGCLQRLDLCQRLLRGLGDADDQSGIGIVLTRHRRLVAVMTEELRTMQDIVGKAMADQQQRTSSALNTAMAEVGIEVGIRERNGLWTSLEPS